MEKERHAQQVAQVQSQCWLVQMHHLKFLQFVKIISDTRSTFTNRTSLQGRTISWIPDFSNFWQFDDFLN